MVRSWSRLRAGAPLALVLAAAAALRLYAIDQPYVDANAWREADMAIMARNLHRGVGSLLTPLLDWNGPEPAYMGVEFQLVSYLAALAYEAVGIAPWVGRAVSLLFSLLGLFALHRLVRLVWDERRALLAAAAYAVLPGAIHTDRSFLSDPAMTALMTTALWLLLRYCCEGRAWLLAAAMLAGTLGALVKLPGLALGLPAAYAVLWLLGRRLEGALLLRLLLAGAFGLAIVATYYLRARYLATVLPPHIFAGQGKFLWQQDVALWLREGWYLSELHRWLVRIYWGLPVTLALLLGLLLPPPRGRAPAAGARWLFHLWLAAMAIRFLFEARHLVSDPYNLHLLHPVAAVFAAHAVASLLERLPLPLGRFPLVETAGAFGLLLLALPAIAGLNVLYRPYHEASRELGLELGRLSQPQELVAVLTPNPVAIYYADRRGWLFPPADRWGREPDRGSGDAAELERLLGLGLAWLALPRDSHYLDASEAPESALESGNPALAQVVAREFELLSDGPAGLVWRRRAQP